MSSNRTNFGLDNPDDYPNLPERIDLQRVFANAQYLNSLGLLDDSSEDESSKGDMDVEQANTIPTSLTSQAEPSSANQESSFLALDTALLNAQFNPTLNLPSNLPNVIFPDPKLISPTQRLQYVLGDNLSENPLPEPRPTVGVLTIPGALAGNHPSTAPSSPRSISSTEAALLALVATDSDDQKDKKKKKKRKNRKRKKKRKSSAKVSQPQTAATVYQPVSASLYEQLRQPRSSFNEELQEPSASFNQQSQQPSVSSDQQLQPPLIFNEQLEQASVSFDQQLQPPSVFNEQLQQSSVSFDEQLQPPLGSNEQLQKPSGLFDQQPEQPPGSIDPQLQPPSTSFDQLLQPPSVFNQQLPTEFTPDFLNFNNPGQEANFFEEVEKMMEREAQVQAQLAHQEAEIGRLQQELQIRELERANFQHDVQQYETNFNALEALRQEQQAIMQGLDERNKNLEDAARQSNESLQEQLARVNDLNAINKSLEDSARQVVVAAEQDLQAKFKNLDEKNKNLEAFILQAEAKQKELQANNKNLVEKNKTLEDVARHANKPQQGRQSDAKLEQSETEIASLEQKLKESELEREKVHKDLEQRDGNIVTLETQHRELQANIKDLTEKNVNLEYTVRQANDDKVRSSKEYAEKETERSKASRDAITLRDQLKKAQAMVLNRNAQIEVFEEKILAATQNSNDLQVKIDRMSRKLTDVCRNAEDYRMLLDDYDSRKAKLEEQEDALDAVHAERDDTNAENERLQRENAYYRSKHGAVPADVDLDKVAEDELYEADIKFVSDPTPPNLASELGVAEDSLVETVPAPEMVEEACQTDGSIEDKDIKMSLRTLRHLQWLFLFICLGMLWTFYNTRQHAAAWEAANSQTAARFWGEQHRSFVLDELDWARWESWLGRSVFGLTEQDMTWAKARSF